MRRFTALMAVLLFLGVSSVAMAETHSRFITGFPVYEPKDGEVFIISNTLDFGDLKVLGAGTAGLISGVSRTDTVKLLNIPAGTIVKNVGVYIKTPWGTSGGTCYGVTIGDGDAVGGWIPQMDFGASASGVSMASSTSGWVLKPTSGTSLVASPLYYAPGGKYYTTADTIDAVLPATQYGSTANSQWYSGGLTNFVLQIWAECVYPRAQKAYKRTGQ